MRAVPRWRLRLRRASAHGRCQQRLRERLVHGGGVDRRLRRQGPSRLVPPVCDLGVLFPAMRALCGCQMAHVGRQAPRMRHRGVLSRPRAERALRKSDCV
eukprot:5408939-Pleurochrysis_carterae.AAC.2